MGREPEYARPDTHPDFVDNAAPAQAMAEMEEQRMEAEAEEKEGEVEEKTSGDAANVENGNPPAEVDKDFDSLTKPELLELLSDKGHNVSTRTTKDELVAMLEKEG